MNDLVLHMVEALHNYGWRVELVMISPADEPIFWQCTARHPRDTQAWTRSFAITVDQALAAVAHDVLYGPHIYMLPAEHQT